MALTYTAASFAVGDPIRPFNNSFWGQQLATPAIDANSAAVVAALAAQSQGANHDMLNVWNWTAEPTIVPASTPLVPVIASGMTSQITSVLKLGVPIPSGWTPTNDTDATGIFWVPDRTAGGFNGTYYECFGMSLVNGTWNARRSAARMVGVNDTTRGVFADWTASGDDPKGYATDPNSSYELHTWGVQGSGLPYLLGLLTVGDCKRGYVDHMLLLEVTHAQQGQYRAPAARSDGGYTSLVLEGMRFRFPVGYQIPSGIPYIQQLLIQGIRDFGCIVTDQSGTLAFRAAPSVGTAGYLGTTPDYGILNGFPWQDLQLLA